MKTLRLFLLIGVLAFFPAVVAYANGISASAENRGETAKNKNFRCAVVQRGPAPLSAILEDAVAYAFDIPLAMLSPLTSLIGPCEDEADMRADRASARRRGK